MKMKYKYRFGLDNNKIFDRKYDEEYNCEDFLHAEKLFHILCHQELKLKLAKSEVRKLQYDLNLANTKLELIDDLILQEISEYCDNSYTPAGSSQTKSQ